MVVTGLLLASLLSLGTAPSVVGPAVEGVEASCGLLITAPEGWEGKLVPVDSEFRPGAKCQIAFRPPNWTKQYHETKWTLHDPPLELIVFEDGVTLKEAMYAIGFEDHEKYGFSLAGGYGTYDEPRPYVAGPFRGFAAAQFFRGFIHEEKTALEQGVSGVYSSGVLNVVLEFQSRVIAFVCSGGNPDTDVDCDAPIESIATQIQVPN